MRIIVTGGAGFVGSAVVRHLIAHTAHEVLVLDKLTYAGNLTSLAPVHGHCRYRFSRTDICDRAAIADAFAGFEPDAIMHLAAESHVDRSIDGPAEFINTNVVGTIGEGMDRLRRCPTHPSHRELITFVPDRPGHDFRYAIDFAKLNSELGWAPMHSFEAGLNATVKWYRDNHAW